MSEKSDLQNQYRMQQDKYTYYIVALCVASIGFSVHVTIDKPFILSQIPLGIAVLCWALSCYFGLEFIGRGTDLIYSNLALIDIMDGQHEFTGTNPQKIIYGSEKLIEIMNIKGKKRETFAKMQSIFFITGIISFIIWHLLEMYIKTNCHLLYK